ncbi:MAG: hypothetical protein AAGH76_02845 [Pseudomonadota bacterium]
MAESILIYTALPAAIRRVNGEWQAQVSVFIAPQLEPDDSRVSLGDYPALVDWPSQLANRRWRIVTATATDELTTTAPLLPTTADTADSAAWRAILPADTAVNSFSATQEQVTAPLMAGALSYEAVPVVDAVRRVYAESLPSQVPRDTGGSALQAFAGLGQPGLLRAGNTALGRFAAFFKPAEQRSVPPRQSASADTEFHSVIAGLGGHGRLLRKLGLVVDLVIPAAELQLDEASRLAVIADGEPLPDLAERSLWTRIEVGAETDADTRSFCAAWRSGALHAGLQALPRDPRNVVQENLEHAFFSLSQQAEHNDPAGVELPTLMSSGMRIVDDALPQRLQQAAAVRQSMLSATGTLGDSAPPSTISGDVYADDLVRGLRIDVRDADGGDWRSLCQRLTRYMAADWSWPAGGDGLADEGVVEPTMYVDRNAASSSFRLPPELFAWDGWSLVVGHPDSGVDDVNEPPAQNSRIQITTNVPAGGLQPQRFGVRYQFRARTVDLAGNSLSLETATDMSTQLPENLRASPAIPCLRAESAQPPVVFPAEPRGPGEAGDAIVLRDADDRRFATPKRRLHVLPAEVSLRTAERHGLFDGLSPDDSWSLIQAHRGSLDVDANGDTRDYIDAKTLVVPYLPDPLGRTAVLILPDGTSVPLPRFDDQLADTGSPTLATAFSLVIEAGFNEVSAKVTGRTVVVRVPRGRVTTLTLAAAPDGDALATSALANSVWTGGHESAALNAAVSMGNAKTIAPHRELDIIHATQRPVTPPIFVAPVIAKRDANASGVVLIDDEFLFDGPSTGRIDVSAEWNEWRDDPGTTGWRRTSNAVAAGGTRIDPDDETPFAHHADKRAALAHDFGDTRHRRVTYRPVATSRFIDYYPATLTADPRNMQYVGQPITVTIPSTAAPAAPEIAYVVPTFERTETRSADGARASSQRGFGLRVYMQRGWFSSGDGEQLAVVFTDSDTGVPTSLWGSDPIRKGAPLPAPLAPAHIASAVETIGPALADANNRVLVLHDVAFSDTHQRPFADIVFETQPTALPMVRLALARYQANAIDDCHLSPIVASDFVALSPDRFVTVTPVSRNRWSVALNGQAYTGRRNSLGRVVATLEEQPLHGHYDEAAWRATGEPVELNGQLAEGFSALWRGEVTYRHGRRSARWRRRLVLREYAPTDVASGKLESVHTVTLTRN